MREVLGKSKVLAAAAVILAAFFSVLVSSQKAAFAAPGLAGRVAGIEGRVDILRAGASEVAPLKQGDEVFVGDIIRTKSDGKAELVMIDKSVMRLGHNSRFGIERYLFRPGRSRAVTVKLYRGKSGFKVPRYALQSNRFHLKTRTAVAGIRGTAGYLVSEEVEAVYVTKGIVKFSNEFGSVLVKAGEIGQFAMGQAPVVRPFTPGESGHMGSAVNLHETGKEGSGGGGGGDVPPPPPPATPPAGSGMPPSAGQPAANSAMLPPGPGVGGVPTATQVAPSTPVNINVNVP